MRTRLVVATTTVAVLALVGGLVLLVGGGDDGPEQQLSSTSASEAILSAADVGEGYESGTDEVTSYARLAPGCLKAVRTLVEGPAPVRVLKTFHGPASAPMSVVTSQVSSYPSGEEARKSLAAFRDATAGCTRVTRAPGKSGYAFEVSTSQPETAGSDEQARLSAVGAIFTANDQGLPFGMWVSVSRVGSSLAIVRLYEVPGEDDGEAVSAARLDGLATAAVQRLVRAS